MTDRAMRSLWVGIAIVVLMGLFPPWVESRTSSSSLPHTGYTAFYSRGYSFLFAPPTENSAAFIDLSRLMVQWVIVAAITLGLVAALNRTPASKGTGETRPP